ncbi:MAG: TIGR03936 family radical SAM-associated protein [Elusimicrobiales bacterium]|jgi:radical SAM-linked protein
MVAENVAKCRMRLRFARLEGAAGFSHLEQIRALRELAAGSGLDCMAAAHGKALVPKMAFGPALPQGYGSRCEYADLYLAQPCAQSVARAKLEAAATGPFVLLSVKRVPVFFPSIEASVSAAGYLVEADFKGKLSREAIDAFFARSSAPYVNMKPKGAAAETIDARPLVLGADLDAAAGVLRLTLKLEPGKNIRPEAAAGVMAGRELAIKKVVREELYWLDSQGKLEAL